MSAAKANPSAPTPSYPRVCPNCGGALGPVVLEPVSPPWLCPLCAHAWWVVELEAAADWDPSTRSWRRARLAHLTATRDQEHTAARERGTSVLPEQLGLLTDVQLTGLAGRLARLFPTPVAPPDAPVGWKPPAPPLFVQQVAAERARRAALDSGGVA